MLALIFDFVALFGLVVVRRRGDPGRILLTKGAVMRIRQLLRQKVQVMRIILITGVRLYVRRKVIRRGIKVNFLR